MSGERGDGYPIAKSFRQRYHELDGRLEKAHLGERITRLLYEAFIGLDEIAIRIETMERRAEKIGEALRERQVRISTATPKRKSKGAQSMGEQGP